MEEDELTPEEEPDFDREPTEAELVQIALENLNNAIEDVLSMLGEDNTSLLTDWAVVAVSQSITDEGQHIASPAILIPRNEEIPIYRLKGLLHDALDGLRNEVGTTIIVVNADSDTEGDDDDD